MTKQQQKKKDREREVHAKLQRRRAAKIKKDKYERDVQKDVRANRPKIAPIRTPLTPDQIAERDKKILSQLEHNMKILKALEEEYDREIADRAKLHENLESEGHLSADEKIKAIAARAKAESEKLENKNLFPEGAEVVLDLEPQKSIKGEFNPPTVGNSTKDHLYPAGLVAEILETEELEKKN